MARSAYGGDTHAAPSYRRPGYQAGAGNMLFAGTILGLIGVFNVVGGIAALDGSRGYPKNAVFTFGDIKTWGWIVLIAGIVQLAASVAIFTKAAWARWFGIAVGVGNAFVQLLFVPVHPVWALAAFAADVFMVKALLTYGGGGIFDR